VLSAEERIRLLCRTFYEAREAWDSRSNGDGVKLMPSLWNEGSYLELELQLAELRDSPNRSLWFHTTRRYRDGEIVTVQVPVHRSARGPSFALPACCELEAGAVSVAERVANVRVYRWRSDVDQYLADLGIDTLAKRMFRGRRDRIVIPDFYYRRALGLPWKDDESHPSPTVAF
jgi:hypothetical protein